ncbi:MAG: alkaline phosphatase D family protein [Phycisphaeraceae bacterium]
MRLHLICRTLIACLLGAGATLAQDAGGGPPGEGPGARMQYKRMHQHALRLIEQGKVDEAIEHLLIVQKKLPEDAETQFMLTVAYAQAGKKNEAIAAMKKAIEMGLPVGRFVAGPRELFKPLEGEKAFVELRKDAAESWLIHGPMLTNLTSTSATFWIRGADEEHYASLMVVPMKAGEVIHDGKIRVSKTSDFTGTITLKGLKPDTEYECRLGVSKPNDPPGARFTGDLFRGPFAFRTPPAPGSKQKLTLAFGGGAGYQPTHEYVWNTIGSFKPDLLLMVGDNVYIDDPESAQMNRYTYYRRQSRPEWRKLVATTPVYSIWDDHDFSTNDSWGGPEIDKPAWKRQVWNIFKENWANPGYGGGEKQPGCWYDFTVGDIHFIMLDCRYYRTNPKKADPTMLGPVQKAWLFDTIKKSRGTFKVLCSSVPWVFEAKGDSLDTWNGYKDERNEIFDFLTKEKIEGVVLLSGDRHRTDLWKIPREKDYPLYEFNSSRLTNDHVHPEMKQAIFSYNKKQSFGIVSFDTTLGDPTVTYKVVSIDGEVMHTFTAKRSELQK